MPPGRALTLRELVEEPFGPYLEQEVLTSACKGTTRKNVTSLRRLILESNGVTTGLNETEACQPGHDIVRFSEIPVHFRGVLEIQSLSWLTESAIESIERELRARDMRARGAHARANPSNISLRRLYEATPGFHGGQLKVKVEIQGIKHLPAVYPTSEHVENGLLIISKATQVDRRYRVDSMHIHTFRLSHLYLARYRVMQVLKDLLALDANSNHFGFNRTPLPKRTPAWFVDLYMKHMAYHGKMRRVRPVHDSDSDSDVAPGRGGRMLAGREHTLRHVARAEVFSHFAAHAEWIVDQVAKMRSKWIDVGVWKAWLVDVRRMRREAARAGVPWGVWEGVEVSLDEDELEDLPLPPKPKRGKKTNQKRGPTRPLSRASRTSGTTSSTRRSTASPGASTSLYYTPAARTGYVDDTRLRTYDPDFSPASTPPGSPSSSSSGFPSRPVSPLDPDLAALIPPEFTVPPQVTATLRWMCTMPNCGYQIDLLNLTDENLATDQITEDDKRRLRSKNWNVGEAWVREAFGYMVDVHWEWHLREDFGLKIEQRGKAFTLSSIHPPESHQTSGRLRKVKKDNRRPVIKEEDR
ncbi:hypothetical protein OH77DRAFT_1390516 [Trametes cingulata]|nr:hypothetical protein OH77DRAFT_1390516 [Trametes cingulata]